METALLKIFQGIQIGKILIQSASKIPKVIKIQFVFTENCFSKQLFYLELPKFKPHDYVLLLEPTLATAATSKMAIRILLDHGVAENRIILVSVFAATFGLQSIYATFPKVKCVTAAIDYQLNEHGFIIPGCGNFADRYFGTGDNESKQ